MDLEKILEGLRLDGRFTKELSEWARPFCPYSNEELNDLCYRRTDEVSSNLKEIHFEFLRMYDSLSTQEKELLKNWLKEKLLIPAWNSGIGIRPKWTWENFFLKYGKDSMKYLDVGPCHGIHSNLIYKEYYKANFEYYAADILPAYLQLQTFFGIKTQYFDASRMSLFDLYGKNSMDLVLFSEVLEHLTPEEGNQIIFDLSLLIKQGGKLLISFPLDARPFNNEPFGHIYQPAVDDVVILLKNNGFFECEYTKLWSGKTYQHVIIAGK